MDDGLISGTLCILKYIQYLRPQFPNKPSILWVLFDSKNIGKLWCHHNKSMYTSVIKKEWTPIWATTHNISYWHITISWKQFPLCPATATTIHSGQGSTFKEICIDVDISALPGLQQSPGFAKHYLHHAHYVATSRVTSLEGLQIINFNEKLINVDENVRHLLSHMHQNPIHISYMPT